MSRCKSCGSGSYRRRRRTASERELTRTLPIRPSQCRRCGRQGWHFAPYADARRQYWGLAGGVVLIGLTVMLMVSTGGGAAPAPVPVAPAAEMAAPVEAEPARLPEPPAEVEPVGAAAPSAAPEKPPPAADAGGRLGALQVQWQAGAMRVDLDVGRPLDAGPPVASAYLGGYYLDLPGEWVLDPGVRVTRRFTRSNLAGLQLTQHPGHLRIVFRLRDAGGPAPELTVTGTGLRVAVPPA